MELPMGACGVVVAAWGRQAQKIRTVPVPRGGNDFEMCHLFVNPDIKLEFRTQIVVCFQF